MSTNEQTPTQAPVSPASEPVETPTTTTNNEPAPVQASAPAQAPDMHGFTSEQLADMKKFFDNNGGFDAIKSKISNPEKPAEPAPAQPAETDEPTSQPQPQAQPVKTPEGAITAQEFLAQQYFQSLAKEEKYAPIAKGIQSGDYLKEMSAFGINALNPDGSINDQKVRMYLDLKAQTVPAKPAGDEPDASTSPTVNYIEVGEKIDNIDQAYAVLMQPGHPKREEAKAFIKAELNPNTEPKK